MKQVKILDWIIEVDPVKTKEFYKQLTTPSVSCGCLYCQNFEKAVPNLPETFLEALAELGIDIYKAIEVYEICEIENGIHLYGGWYHLNGRIAEGNDSFSTPVHGKGQQANLQQLEDNFFLGFTEGTNLVPKDFPEPVLQIEFTGNLPWLLNETPNQ